MKKALLIMYILCSFFLLNNIASQSLVTNYSFEEYTMCPNGPDELNYALSWYSSGASPDYFNECATWSYFLTPGNWFGFQYPKTGKGYAGIIVYHNLYSNYREYAGCKLYKPLDANKQYCVEFYVSLSDSSKYITSNIGAYFSDSNNIATGAGVLNYLPQIANPDTLFLSDKQNWMKISGCFTSNGGEEYLTIGNFKNDSIIDTLSTNYFGNFEGQYESYYYIDDVTVIEDTNTDINNFSKNQFSVYPNPCNNNLNIEHASKNEIKRIFLIDALGNIIKELAENQDNKSYDIKNLQNGFYILRIILSNKSIINYKLIINN